MRVIGIAGAIVNSDGEVVGSAGAGKDTVAERLVKQWGFVKIGLADPMKRIVRELLPCVTNEHLWGPSAMRSAPVFDYPVTKLAREAVARAMTAFDQEWRTALAKEFGDAATKHFLTLRPGLQTLGSDWGRAWYEDVWVRKCLDTAKDVLGDPGCSYTPQRGAELRAPDDKTRTRGVAVSDVRFKNEGDAILDAGGWVVVVERPGVGLPGAAGTHESEVGLDTTDRQYFNWRLSNYGTIADLASQVDRMMIAFNDFNPPRPA